MARPRDNCRHFLDLAGELKEPTTFSFSALDMKLPAAVNIVSHEYALASKEPSGFHLAAVDATENVVGTCRLVSVRLSNAG